MKLKSTGLSLIIFFLIGMLVGCSHQSGPNEIKIGTIAGPETQLMEVARTVLEKESHIKLDIIPFTNYPMPNAALNDGSIDANMFQHKPYLEADSKAHDYHLTAIAKTFIYPMAIYSKSLTSLKQIPDNALVAVPNDPSNNARALLLLAKAKLITLKSGVELPTQMDIQANPKHLKIKAISAAQLARVLPDVSIAVINTNYAIPAGLLPKRDGLFEEGKDSPYANILVVRTKDKELPKFKKLILALHSKKVLDAAKKLFNGQAIPAW